MSDSKRATLITVGANKNQKNKVNKTVRLTINLVESNESKYPELNYKELVIAEVKNKKPVENGKTTGLNPYSDNDDDVERVARKFEQKYGGKSTYGKKSKRDDFADIGAGYDENDSFIDNTDGYDEMIPPECETFYGGFYINSGQLEFKNAENQAAISDAEPAGRRNKRRISSSSSEEESSESSSDSESQEEKEPKQVPNGNLDSTGEHRKKKNKNIDKKKPKKIRRTDSSAATSGKQTSDDNAHESADSRASQSDSLTSKPAPSSENAATSDSSRDTEDKSVKLPLPVSQALEELEAAARGELPAKMGDKADPYLIRLERALSSPPAGAAAVTAAWARAARALALTPHAIADRLKHVRTGSQQWSSQPNHTQNKRKNDDVTKSEDLSRLTDEEREAKIVETLAKLKALIEERKPDMMANYTAECERVQEERKKLQLLSDGAPHPEKRLPKRRFPWCARARALLARLRALAADPPGAALLLAQRALPLFPNGFVRMPTLLRQADLSKEIKVSDIKRPRLGSASQPPPPLPAPAPAPVFTEPIQFPSSLTVTTTQKPDKAEPTPSTDKDKYHPFENPLILNSFTLNKDLIVEKHEDKRKETPTDKTEDLYIPPNNIGSITITPVPNNPKVDKKLNNSTERDNKDKNKEPLLRIKTPASLNEMVHKREKEKALEMIHKKDKYYKDKDKHKKDKHIDNHKSNDKHHSDKPNDKHHDRDRHADRHKPVAKEVSVIKEKRVHSPLHIDTSFQPKQKEPTPSPKSKEEISRREIETMRVAENNIPRPALVPVTHSPTFAKPTKPPETKKKKDILIVSDVDPLSDQVEPVAIDDSSSDVELVEDSDKRDRSDVPSRDKVSVRENHKDTREDKSDDATEEDISSVMKKLRDLENSQEPKFNSNSFSGVITSSKRDKSSGQQRGSIFAEPRDKDKFAERTSLNKMDGCSAVNG